MLTCFNAEAHVPMHIHVAYHCQSGHTQKVSVIQCVHISCTYIVPLLIHDIQTFVYSLPLLQWSHMKNKIKNKFTVLVSTYIMYPHSYCTITDIYISVICTCNISLTPCLQFTIATVVTLNKYNYTCLYLYCSNNAM